MQEWSFPSSNGQSQIHAACHPPAGKPKAVLQVCHGISEYFGRYRDFAAFFAAQGYAVVGGDHLGHGLSAPTSREQDFFAESDGWMHVTNDVRAIRDEAARRYPGLPCYLFGHSMGSFVARTCLIRWPDGWDGAVLCGTGQMPRPVLLFGRALLTALAQLHGLRGKSRFAYDLVFGSYCRRISNPRTPIDWLSVDPGNVDAYQADPLCGRMPTIGLMRDMLRGMSYNERPANLRRMNPSLPVRFISGADDPVGSYGAGVRKAAASFRKAGMRDLAVELVPGGRHEIFFDREKERLMQQLLDWLEAFPT